MAIKEKITNIVSKIRNAYNGLEPKKKILTLAVIGIFLFIIVSIFRMNSSKEIDYKHLDINLENAMMDRVTDNDLYVTLMSISENFLNKNTEYQKNKIISEDLIYNEILSEEYRDYLSKNKFKKMYNDVVEKYQKIKQVKGEFIPERVSTNNDGRYILKYSCTSDSENVELLIGIQLNKTYNKYYIWYIG